MILGTGSDWIRQNTTKNRFVVEIANLQSPILGRGHKNNFVIKSKVLELYSIQKQLLH